MRVLFLDCFSGISGDMTVGALCDLGVKPSMFEWELSKVGIGDFHMHFDRVQKQAITAVKFGIHEGSTHSPDQDEKEHQAHQPAHEHEHGHQQEHGEECGCGHEHGEEHDHPHGHAQDHDHGHGHEHQHGHEHEHGHGHQHGHAHGRSHAEIRKLILESELSDFVKSRALAIFQRIAVAEGKIHGMSAESVTFHEVGALDSIADIICACVGIEALGVEKVIVSPLHEGRGWIDCAHGRFPIPSTATLEILAGVPLAQVDEEFEFITPTGAAIVAEFGSGFAPMPRMITERVGYGAGSRALPGRPNVLRAVLGTLAQGDAQGALPTDTISRIETNLDDCTAEIIGATVERLMAAGALDVFLTPVQMKKLRPGTMLTVLCESSQAETLARIVLRETTSFGVRVDEVRRWKLERRMESAETPWGKVPVKIGHLGAEVFHSMPEFDACRALAEKAGVTVQAVYDAAKRAAAE